MCLIWKCAAARSAADENFQMRKKMAEENNQADQLAEYRKWIFAAEQKSQEDFDKTVLSLSGGAVGI